MCYETQCWMALSFLSFVFQALQTSFIATEKGPIAYLKTLKPSEIGTQFLRVDR